MTAPATFGKPVRPVATSIAGYRQFAQKSLRRLGIAAAAFTLTALGLNVPAAMANGSSKAITTYVEPAAGFGFLDRAVLGAKHTIELSMYELEDPTMESDLVAQARAGVVVK